MATAIVKRLKNGATHYAAAVNKAGVVQSWSDSEAKAVPVTPEQARAMEDHYAGKRNCGTLLFLADGREVGRIETPTDGPPPPSAWDELRSMLELPETATSTDIVMAACAELKAFGVGGTVKEGPSPWVRADVAHEEIVNLRREHEWAKSGPAQFVDSVSLVVDDASLDKLMAGESVTGFDAGVTVTLTRPTPVVPECEERRRSEDLSAPTADAE